MRVFKMHKMKEGTSMKRFLWPVIALIITAFLVAMLSFSAGGALASATRIKPKPTPTPSPTPVKSGGVNSQTNGNLNPGDTFCLPVQQIAGIQGGFVEGGGSSYKYPGAPPIDTRWTAYNGSTASSLQAIHTVTYSFVVMADTVPIGSFYQVCMTNITSGVVTFNIQQSEYTNDPPFP
jgi:hypothetical protein